MPEPTPQPQEKGKWQRLAETLDALARREETWDLTPVFEEKVRPLMAQLHQAAVETGLPMLVVFQTANDQDGGLFSSSSHLPGSKLQIGDPLWTVYKAARKAQLFDEDAPGEQRSPAKCAACEMKDTCPIRADRDDTP
jgi:hypothetical protein